MILTAALIVTAPANAAIFNVNVTPIVALGTCVSGNAVQNAPVAVSGACTGSSLGSSSGSARAGFGGVGAKVEAIQVNASQTIPAVHFASAAYSDTVVFSSSDPTRTFVDVALDMRLDGISELTLFPFGQGGPNFGGDVVIDSSRFRFAFDRDGGTLGGFSLVSGAVSSLGRTDALLRTGLVRVGVNIPVFFELSLNVRTGHIASSGRVDFLNSFEIPTNRPAFRLPDGVTANSGTWLVDNRRVVPGVPEPGSWAMLIAGFGAVGVMRRRRGPERRAAC